MKAIKIHLKTVALFFSILIFFQGCTVYKSANVTLEEAAMSNTKVRIKTNDHKTFWFKKIGVENGNYYGLKAIYLNNNNNNRVKINIENINRVQVKDKTLSTVSSIGIPVVVIVVIFAIIISSDPYLSL